jgi:putative transposase
LDEILSLLRRYYSEGQVYFVTIVTFDRIPLLADHAGLLLESLGKCKSVFNLDMGSWVILPDHCHFIVDPRTANLSGVVHRLKMVFAGGYRKASGRYTGRLWQNRFWDHIIRNQEDMNRHIDYIHYNPVHHGYAQSPFDYTLSSARLYLESGDYQPDWGRVGRFDPGQFGE